MRYQKILLRLLAIALICLLSLLIIFPLKPILFVRFLNQHGSFKQFELGILFDILNEKYSVISTKGDYYNLVVDGVFGTQPIKNKKAIKIFYVYEGVPAKTEGYDLSIGFEFLEQENYIRIPFYYAISGEHITTLNTDHSRGQCNPNKPYFACFLVSNYKTTNPFTGKEYDGVVFRDKLFHLLSLYKKVESGGGHLNNIGHRVNDTVKWFNQCKFIIASENQSFSGYITEKVFTAYNAGAIPLYYSDLEAVKDINKQAVIFAPDFTSEEALVEYIQKVDNDDELYCKIWNEKLITDPARNYETIKSQPRKKLELIFKKLNKHNEY